MLFPLKDYLPHSRTPVVTLVLIALNVLVYLFGFGNQTATNAPVSLNKHDVWVYEWGTIPCEVLARCDNQTGKALAKPDPLRFPGMADRSEIVPVQVPDRSPWLTLIASAFLHGGLLHLVFNMLFLWVFGGNVEDSMSRFAFLGFYLSAAVVSALMQCVVHPSAAVPQVGASGAIAGVIGAYLLLYPRTRVLTMVIIPIFVRLPAWVVAGGWGVLQFISTWQSLFVPGAADSSVAYMAHLSGFVFGLLMIRRIGVASPEYEHLYGGDGDERGT